MVLFSKLSWLFTVLVPTLLNFLFKVSMPLHTTGGCDYFPLCRGRERKILLSKWFSSVQLLSRVRLFATPWITACQASLSLLNQLPECTQTHAHQVSDAIQPSHPLSSPSPPAPNPSQHQALFQRVNSSHQVAKYWSFSFSISLSNEHPGLIFFRMDCLDLLAVQGTLKSLIQHHSSKESIFQHSAFRTVQLLHPYMTTGKTIALTRWTCAVNIYAWRQRRKTFPYFKKVSRVRFLPIPKFSWATGEIWDKKHNH